MALLRFVVVSLRLHIGMAAFLWKLHPQRRVPVSVLLQLFLKFRCLASTPPSCHIKPVQRDHVLVAI